jgi:HAMP domain-containing protein
MKIENRLHMTTVGIFLVGWLILGIATLVLELKTARVNNVRLAKVMLSTATAARDYTSRRLEPLLSTISSENFIQERIPAHGAQAIFKGLGNYYTNEGYKYVERALNPTSPKDMAEDWQVELIRHFSENSELKEVVDVRVDRSGRGILYVAEPIRVTSASCLRCHGDPELAPPNLIKTYGKARGFGWQLNEVVATRIVSVPTSVCLQQAYALTLSYAILSASIFLLAYVAINAIIRKWLTRPLDRIAQSIDELSVSQSMVNAQLSDMDSGSLGKLNKAVHRLLLSLNKFLLSKNK